MTIHYCDLCGKQIEPGENVVDPATRYEPTMTFKRGPNNIPLRVSAEVIVAINGTTNKGDLCLPCLLHLLNEGAGNERL